VVKVFADNIDLCIGFFGEGIAKVCEDDFFAVADAVKEDKIHEIGKQV
jgi:hypothetical protein